MIMDKNALAPRLCPKARHRFVLSASSYCHISTTSRHSRSQKEASTRMWAHAAVPLVFTVTDMALSFAVTVTLDAGFKHEEGASLGQLQSLYNKPIMGTQWKPWNESLAKAWSDLLTRPIEGTADGWKVTRSIQSLVSWEAEYEQNSALSAACACWGHRGCWMCSLGKKRPHTQLFEFTWSSDPDWF